MEATMDEKEKLFREIGDSHMELFHTAQDLNSIAREVRYLHPNLSDELRDIAKIVQDASKKIQGNHSQILSAELADSQRFTGEMLSALLTRATQPA